MEIERRKFIALLSVATASATLPLSRSAGAGVVSTPPPPANARTLIRGATLMTMDPAIGDLEHGDVLIEGRNIVKVAPKIEAGDAQVIDAQGMILMPGMIDGHRHLWVNLIAGYQPPSGNFLFDAIGRLGICFRPEEVGLANYIGGANAIDSGVTSALDHCHILQSPENAEAAIEGSRRAGIGGIFCYQLPTTFNYGPGSTVDAEQAWQQLMGPANKQKIADVRRVRDEYFSDSESELRFGVALTAMEWAIRSREQVHDEFRLARELEPELISQHVLGVPGSWRMGLDRNYRLIPDLHEAGLLGPDYNLSHGNGLTDEELIMLRDAGSSVTATPTGEFVFAKPSIHGRAHAIGLKAALGIDSVAQNPSYDYFETMRTAWLSLFRSAEGVGHAYGMGARGILEMATIGGARALGIDGRVGSITPGKQADLVLLRTDRAFYPNLGPLHDRVVQNSTVADIDSVWVAGKIRKQNGVLLDYDVTETRRRALAAIERVQAEANTIKTTGKMGNVWPTLTDADFEPSGLGAAG
jgi:cytosine/adenosine deaminase-related metal-dependent hydrolase